MELLLRCGCRVPFQESADVLCPRHGPQGVARALGVPPPRIRGVASGPHVQMMDLPAFTGRIAGSEPAKE